MDETWRRILVWAPRVLTILFIAFVSLFALDVFDERLGFWRTLAALAIHLIPTWILIAMLALAWRWEWVGAAMGTVLGLLLLWMQLRMPHFYWANVLVIPVPVFVIAALFLLNWLKRAQLHPRP